MEKIKVFCLPYAGGNKTIYSDWLNMYSDIAEIIPLEYSGHGSRFCDELYDDAEKISYDVFESIVDRKPANYIMYGHSMGSLIAYLTGYKLENEYKYPPKALIIGGTRPPHLKYKDEALSELPKDKLIDKMVNLGQMDDEIINEPELLDLLADIFQADIKAYEKYCVDFSKKVKCPVYVATGSEDDEAPMEDMEEWKMYAEGFFTIRSFEDSHFFPFTNEEYPSYFKNIIRDIIAYNL